MLPVHKVELGACLSDLSWRERNISQFVIENQLYYYYTYFIIRLLAVVSTIGLDYGLDDRSSVLGIGRDFSHHLRADRSSSMGTGIS